VPPAIAETKTYTARGFLDVFTSGSVYSLDLNYHPDGNIATANDSVNGNWSYSYDDFNRLSAASKTGASYTWAYDRYGNRWQQNGPVSKSIAFTTTNNRAASGGSTLYDASGNVRQEGTAQYTFDAENRMIAAPGASYVYDADGKRVRKTVGGNNSDFLYDLAGHSIMELYNGNWSRTEIYAGGRRVATYSGGTTNFNHADWLGTTRVSTSPAGAVTQSCTNLPFGDGQTCTGTNSSPNHFTDKERDLESGLDYFGARFYNSTQGRFGSSDPINGSGKLFNPQSLNRYSYTFNNPLRYIDPDGAETKFAPGLSQKDEDRWIKNLTEIYRRPAGRAGLDKLKKSDLTFVFGTANFQPQDRKGPNGQTLHKFGEVDPNGVKGTRDIDPKTNQLVVASVDQKNSQPIPVQVDFKHVDKHGAEAGQNEKDATNHEVGHAVELATDPVVQLNRTQAESENAADAFVDNVKDDKADMDKTEAEAKVRQMFGVSKRK
jgi:RHS repeat-associated protein